jgi:hypothetical protein
MDHVNFRRLGRDDLPFPVLNRFSAALLAALGVIESRSRLGGRLNYSCPVGRVFGRYGFTIGPMYDVAATTLS